MKIADYIDGNLDAIIEHACRLINLKTVLSEPVEGGPFGEGIKAGLCTLLETGESLGFHTKNYDGYAGEISTGKGGSIVGILGHIDVVDAGEGWNTAPFAASVIDHKIYGRGAVDDKTPLIMALYAMKYCKEQNLIPEDCQVKMIIGTDEETLWRGIDYYKRHCGILPGGSIVVDGDFPAIYAEKGLLDFDLIYERGQKEPQSEEQKVGIRLLNGGAGRNVVPSKAFCTLEGSCVDAELMEKFFSGENFQWELTEKGAAVSCRGIPTHAMNPENGQNAISVLIERLNLMAKEYETDLDDFLQTYHRSIGMDYNGAGFDLDFEDADTGKLSFNVGTICMTEDEIQLACNIRYPAGSSYEDVMNVFNQSLKKSGFRYSQADHLAPVNIDQTSPFVMALKKAYQETTGDIQSEMKAIGGATYARALDNAVAFGPILPWRQDCTHEADEYIEIEDIKIATEIYIRALINIFQQ